MAIPASAKLPLLHRCQEVPIWFYVGSGGLVKFLVCDMAEARIGLSDQNVYQESFK